MADPSKKVIMYYMDITYIISLSN